MTPPLPSGTVTLLFTDIEGSTALLDRLGDEYGALLADHRRLLRAVWARHEGVEVGTDGDSFFVAFADVESAVEAAIAAQRTLASHAWPSDAHPRVRMGLHTGEPRINQGDYWGADVHYAARIGAAAHGGQILASQATRAMDDHHEFESLGEHSLKDFVAPRELFHLVVDGTGPAEFPPPRTLEPIRTNLPSTTTELIGREDELAVVLELMSTARMVTVSGPGGSGKTRLALEAAHRAAEDFDAVWWVSLEHVLDPNEVMSALSRAMGLPEVAGVDADERVLDHLRARSVLLVLDNLEHVIDVAPLIGHVARAGPEVRVLITSQLPMRIGGEHVIALDPLPVPTGSERELSALCEIPSVALLCERAAAAGTGWSLTEENKYDVARLCRQLEGMPLALELAAPRLRVLDAGALSHRLEESLDALGSGGRDLPARQRGMRAVLGWSVGLLSDGERALLLRLAVFSAGFTAALAGAAFGDVVDELEALMAAGLIRAAPDERIEVRPPVRRFAAELLDADEDDAAHAAITDALIALAEPFEKRWVVIGTQGRLALNPEAGNILAELDWAQLMDYGRHARLAASTGWWMNYSSAVEISRDHLEIALARSTEAVMRARCLQALGALGLKDSDPTGSLDAADAWHDLGDAEGEFYSVIYAANLYGHAREPEAQVEVVERAAELTEQLPDDPDAGWILAVVRAEAVWLSGDPDAAIKPLLPLFHDAPDLSWKQFWLATRLADLELVLHRPAEALAHYGMAMAVLAPLHSPLGEIIQGVTVSVALWHLGRIPEAATAWAVCELGFDELSSPPHGGIQEWYDAVRESLADDDLAAGRRRASPMGMERGLAWIGQVARGEIAAP
ncbi:MAG TPA: adenylate/guanylate cyclase domain-containing protein [Solirubrobacteraceae bacterium]|nr:adenylate/guanylate cyclase domain-containing protein [Solirubrobacteraceae bacterium]